MDTSHRNTSTVVRPFEGCRHARTTDDFNPKTWVYHYGGAAFLWRVFMFIVPNRCLERYMYKSHHLFAVSPTDVKLVTCSDDGMVRIFNFIHCSEEFIILRGNAHTLVLFAHVMCGVKCGCSRNQSIRTV